MKIEIVSDFNSGTSSRWCFFFCLWIWIEIWKVGLCVEAGKLEKPVLKPPDGKDAILRQIELTCDVRCGRRTQATVAKTMVLTTASYLIPMFKWSQNWSLWHGYNIQHVRFNISSSFSSFLILSSSLAKYFWWMWGLLILVPGFRIETLNRLSQRTFQSHNNEQWWWK